MGMKLLKRLSSRKNSSRKSLSTSSHKPTVDDSISTETSSESSSLSCRTALSPIGVEVEALCQAGKFDKVLKRIAASTLEDWRVHDDSDNEADSATENQQEQDKASWPKGVATPLHLAVTHKKFPAETLKALVAVLKERFNILVPEEFPDHLGRTPLHVAIISGCTEEVAKALLEGEMLLMPALHLDDAKRTPLHHSCLPITSSKRSRKVAMAQFHQKQVTAFLVNQFPEATFMKDAAGKTPLDYAKESTLAACVPGLERQFNICASQVKKENTAASQQVDAPLEDWVPIHVPGVLNPDDDNMSDIVDMDEP